MANNKDSIAICVSYNRKKLSEHEQKLLDLFIGTGKAKSKTLLNLLEVFARDYNLDVDKVDKKEMLEYMVLWAKYGNIGKAGD